MNKLFTVKGVKFQFSAQGRDLAPFVDNGTEFKIPSVVGVALPIVVAVKKNCEKKLNHLYHFVQISM